jgi:hypothetical protein
MNLRYDDIAAGAVRGAGEIDVRMKTGRILRS